MAATEKSLHQLKNLSLEDNEAFQLLQTADTLQELLKSLAEQVKSNPKSTFDALVHISAKDPKFSSLYQKARPDSKKSANIGLLATLVASEKSVHSAFGSYISSIPSTTELAQLYNTLLYTSDPFLSALFSVYASLSISAQRSLLEIVLDALKLANSKKQTEKQDMSRYQRTRATFLDLQLISRYFIHSSASIKGSEGGLPANATSANSAQEIQYVSRQRSKVLSLIAPYADRRLSPRWVSPVALVILKLLEIDHDSTIADLKTLVEDLLLLGTDTNTTESNTNSSVVDMNLVIISFSIISLLFQVDKDVGLQVFMSDAVMSQQKLFNVTLNDTSASLFSSEQSVVAALDMLSSACNHKDSRALIKSQFLDVVKYALDTSDKPSVRVLAASILVKTSYSEDNILDMKKKKEKDTTGEKKDDVDLKEMSIIFESEIAKKVDFSSSKVTDEEDFELDDSESDLMSRSVYEVALTGLAFTSLKTDTKKRIIENQNILDNLVTVITRYVKEIPWVYCALSVFINVTAYAPKITAEQEKLTKLKEYAQGGQKKDIDQKLKDTKEGFESDEVVAVRNRKVLETTKLVEALTTSVPHFTQTCCNSAASVLRNLATDKKTRGLFAQQGGISVLLYLIIEKDDSKSAEKISPDDILKMNWNNYKVDPHGLVVGTSGLARVIISVDPSHAFGSKLSPTVAVLPLLRQLANVKDVGGSSGAGSSGSNAISDLPLLDIFEALLALTNLAAVDSTCRDIIVRVGWPRIENLILSGNPLVQRASIELICNLATSSKCAEMFCETDKNYNVLPTSLSRLELLAALTDLDDAAARNAAAGAIATLTGWGGAVDMVMRQCPKLITRLIDVVKEEIAQMQKVNGSEDSGMLIRSLSTFEALIGEGLEEIMGEGSKSEDPSEAMKKMVEKSKKDAREFILKMNKELRPMLPTLITKSQDPDVKELSGDLFRTLASFPV